MTTDDTGTTADDAEHQGDDDTADLEITGPVGTAPREPAQRWPMIGSPSGA